MAIRDIITWPDAALEQPASSVTAFDDTLGCLVEDLIDTLHSTSAVALSAPQLGDARAVLVFDLSETRTDPQIFINPKIHGRRGMTFVQESCLSLPGMAATVRRAAEIDVVARTPDGGERESRLNAMASVCLQHEADHLDGVLFIDRLLPMHRWAIGAGKRAADRRMDLKSPAHIDA